MPWDCNGLEIRYGNIEDALPFVKAHYADIFGVDDGRFLADPMCARKERFYRDADVFLIHDGPTCVGLQIAHPTDWSTYYVRSLAILPAYRGRGILDVMTDRMSESLAAAGVERLEGELAPTNGACLIAQTRLGYVPTGTHSTERWGVLVRLTKFLQGDASRVFQQQFCGGAWTRPAHGSSRAPRRTS